MKYIVLALGDGNILHSYYKDGKSLVQTFLYKTLDIFITHPNRMPFSKYNKAKNKLENLYVIPFAK